MEQGGGRKGESPPFYKRGKGAILKYVREI
jgi:hypothetical protein